jgi:hypothetical protein
MLVSPPIPVFAAAGTRVFRPAARRELPRETNGALLAASFLLALAAWLSGAYAAQVPLTFGFFIVNTILLARAARVTLQSRAMGPGLLAASVWLYFVLEALAGAAETPACSASQCSRSGSPSAMRCPSNPGSRSLCWPAASTAASVPGSA